MKKCILVGTFLLISFVASCSNKKESKNPTEPTPELVGTFSFEKNGTPVLEIIDSLVAGKKVKYLRLPKEKRFFFLASDFSNVSGGKSLENTKLVNFKLENDWLHSVAEFYVPTEIKYNSYTIFSIEKKIKISNKLSETSYGFIKKLYPESVVNEYKKEMNKGFVLYSK
ncbi:hypothetical protein [Tenacibaculum finnmarkense]|uniref:Lipoprotein n=1 Tax=Tenacibaculum finnmarkense genomovar finnmarkense TaxID=1458503 RepID=A0AAP1RHQ5_9FLAO|nr:hypothetical protein [Tenacibaculum finnmarkense]MBE7653873.1 hypothetical protein [Tenacibaculum finnmarkense genomovar finnmarkense]MBE7696176.1 hypothetical protein [Tenacibaculum finnmarkense genomovar finnmarkense]MCD8428392.1 hypothetical protein [Tenacibaculum finnmarkense genomovar finnmarkense]MCG8732164.1 hypothetical protein [Tenacibaculum finnmarkense]MCG8752749.1 hypothetical protein [Tenacibaculum finnmarkense]